MWFIFSSPLFLIRAQLNSIVFTFIVSFINQKVSILLFFNFVITTFYVSTDNFKYLDLNTGLSFNYFNRLKYWKIQRKCFVLREILCFTHKIKRSIALCRIFILAKVSYITCYWYLRSISLQCYLSAHN